LKFALHGHAMRRLRAVRALESPEARTPTSLISVGAGCHCEKRRQRLVTADWGARKIAP